MRFINSGGFGCTYEAVHVVLEQRVAIKEFFVKDFCNRDETTAHITVGTVGKRALVDKLRRKFIDEAKALFRLRHRGIVRVTDVFEENGTAYYVMDYIDGLSLGEMVNRDGAMPEARAVRYIRQVAAALGYVHDNNRLHLDIKPGNIMIDAEDNAVVIDFGTSKQYDEEAGENTSTLMGKTPGYAPLEQMGNNVVKFLPATDIYALGATLYKLITGITPLGANMLASGEELDPLPPTISVATRRTIAAPMQLNKNNRPQTIAAFIALLNADAASAAVSEETVFDDDETITVMQRTPRVEYSEHHTYTESRRSGSGAASAASAGRPVASSPASAQPDYVPPTSYWGCWRSAWRNKFNFKGRASRREFWSVFLSLIVICLGVLVASVMAYDEFICSDYDYYYYSYSSYEEYRQNRCLDMFYPINFTLFLFIISTMALECRRLRDAGHSVLWALLFNALPVVFINMLIWYDAYNEYYLFDYAMYLVVPWVLLAWTMFIFLVQRSVFEPRRPKLKK